MPMKPSWYDEARTIIKVDIPPDSTWDEYYDVIRWIVAEMQKVEHRVHVIFFEEVGMPKGNPIPHIKWGTQKLYTCPNMGDTIITGTRHRYNTFARIIMQTIAKSFLPIEMPKDLHIGLFFLPSLQVALDHIQQRKTELEAGNSSTE